MRTVILYGDLETQFGKRHTFDAANAGEVIRALKANFKGFEKYMINAHKNGVAFRVFVGKEKLESAGDINLPSHENGTIRIVPTIMGAASGPFKLILGIALIAAAVALSPFTGGTSLAFLPGALGAAGIGLVIGGIGQMLTSAPKIETGVQGENKKSYIFNGPANVTAQGSAIPILYGRMIVGSAVISAGITVDENA